LSIGAQPEPWIGVQKGVREDARPWSWAHDFVMETKELLFFIPR
jgi:hypothetical protein